MHSIYGHKVSLVVFWCLAPYALTGRTTSACVSQGPACAVVGRWLIQFCPDISPFPLPFFPLLSGTRNSVFLTLQWSAPRFPQTESSIWNVTAGHRGAVETGVVEIHPSQHWAAAFTDNLHYHASTQDQTKTLPTQSMKDPPHAPPKEIGFWVMKCAFSFSLGHGFHHVTAFQSATRRQEFTYWFTYRHSSSPCLLSWRKTGALCW